MASNRKRAAIAIVLFWLLMVPLGGYAAYRYLGNTKMVYKAPSNSQVAMAEKAAGEFFTDQVFHNPLYLLFSTTGSASLLNPTFETLSRDLRDVLLQKPHHPFGLDVRIISVRGYYYPPLVPRVQRSFINDNATKSLIVVDIDHHMGTFHRAVEAWIDSWLSNHSTTIPPSEQLSYRTTSVDQIFSDLENGILGDMVKIDGLTFPFAVAALAYCVGSVRMLVLPMLGVFVTFSVALGIMYPISTVIDVSSFAPELSAAVMIAVTTDYSLFILSRFNEQVKYQEALRGDRSEETKWLVATNTAKLCAENILVSGLTIAGALGGLALLPVSFLSSIGIAFCVSSVTAVVVSLTLMPSLLFLGYEFFRVPFSCPDCLGRLWQRIRCCGEPDEAESGSEGAFTDLERHQRQERKKQEKSPWFKMGRLAFRHPILVSLAVCAIGAPFFYSVSLLQVDFNLFNQVPRDSPHGGTLREIVSDIGNGAAVPFYVVIDTEISNGIMTNEVFAFCGVLAKNINRMCNQPIKGINGFGYVEGHPIVSVQEANFFYNANHSEYRVLFDATVDRTRRVGMLIVSPPTDPFAAGMNQYLNELNDAISLSLFQSPINATVGFMGASADSWAIMRNVMDFFPTLIGITFGVIFVFIAVVFRSIFIPLRMLFTVAYTVGGAFGFGVLVFQYDWSHSLWTALDGVHSYVWLVPIMSFSLLCALALDYDVFLVTRIIELKRIGFDDEAAISKGVWKTGRIISFAGIIMAISFGSLMLSNVTMLNQFGLISFSAVLMDTFIIRPLFTPALMSVYPKLSWWPRRFTPHLTVDDMDEMPAEESKPLLNEA